MTIERLVKLQRNFYYTGAAQSYAFRMEALCRLEQTVKSHEKQLERALKKDLNKSGFESYMTEIGLFYSELTHAKKHLKNWMKPKRKPTPVSQFHAKSFEISEPLGVVLIMAPWNYPFLLTFAPLIGAIAAGNCCILKPSRDASNTSALIRHIVEEAFPANYISVVEGGREENKQLLSQKFDHIFFTGSKAVGKIVMEHAARRLTPCNPGTRRKESLYRGQVGRSFPGCQEDRVRKIVKQRTDLCGPGLYPRTRSSKRDFDNRTDLPDPQDAWRGASPKQ